MASLTFDEFVQREQQLAQVPEDLFDPQAEKQQWLQSLNQLYARITEFLNPYVVAHSVTIQYRDLDLEEEQLGRYKAPEMILTIGTKRTRLVPIGTMLIGSKGRVDVIGSARQARLLLMNSKVSQPSQVFKVSVSVDGKSPSLPHSAQPDAPIEWAWKILTQPPNLKILDCNRENFLRLLVQVANG